MLSNTRVESMRGLWLTPGPIDRGVQHASVRPTPSMNKLTVNQYWNMAPLQPIKVANWLRGKENLTWYLNLQSSSNSAFVLSFLSTTSPHPHPHPQTLAPIFSAHIATFCGQSELNVLINPNLLPFHHHTVGSHSF